jgi:hypothetical protein
MRDLVLGREVIRGGPVIVPGALRFRHLFIIGKSGKGKSNLLARLIDQDIRAGGAVIVLDAGDLARDVLETMPAKHLPRTIFFSVERPVPYNPLTRRRDDPARLENELAALIDQVTAERSNTPPLTARMKRLFSIVLAEVLREPAPTLSDVVSFLHRYRTPLRAALHLPEEDYSATHDGLLDRLGFLRDARIRRILCAPPMLDFASVIDRGQVLLLSLAGLEPALKRFVGAVLLAGVQHTILERPRDGRVPVRLFIDEAHDYLASTAATQNFQLLCSQGRKYLAAMACGHTDYGQMDPRLVQTIHGTVASFVAFACGPAEAAAMSAVAGGQFLPEQIAFLSDHEALARIDDRVAVFRTRPPLPRLRRVAPALSDPEYPTPPDPLEVDLGIHDAQPRTTPTRRPRRVAA